ATTSTPGIPWKGRPRGGLMLRSVLAGLTALAVTLVPASCAPAIGPAADDPYFPGMGDSGFDVQHYRITVRMNPDSGWLRGRAVVTAQATSDLSRFHLELALRADSVAVNGQQAQFWRGSGLQLVVQPAATVPANTPMIVEINYRGNPARADRTDDYPWLRGAGEQLGIGEPRIAPWWFPANDHPRDKARYDVVGFVPRGQQFVSNGRLVATRDVGRWSRWHWQMAEPMPSYATLFAAGDYRLQHRGGTWPATYAVSQALSPADQRANLRLLRTTAGLVRWLQTQFGPYPFGQVGGLVSGTFDNEDWSMETQTRPTYPDLTEVSDARALLVHELAHQWFGDSVTPARWRDIWLNEGFARWAEVRYAETHGGRSGRDWLGRQWRGHHAGSQFWQLQIGDPGPDHLFAWAVYDRGAMAVEALRQRIGDPDFFRLVRLWTEQNRWGTVTVEQFEALAEQVAGQDLSAFFQAWLMDQGRPAWTPANGLG
ncbi:MAG TPA: M1 family metallopeptidase, partial [Actinomycetota bacterium]|nr:M1 family metallopeptidase [Actinomycetota bacterium]